MPDEFGQPREGEVVDTGLGPMEVFASYTLQQAIADNWNARIDEWGFTVPTTPDPEPITLITSTLWYAILRESFENAKLDSPLAARIFADGLRGPTVPMVSATIEEQDAVKEYLRDRVIPHLVDSACKGEPRNYIFTTKHVLDKFHPDGWALEDMVWCEKNAMLVGRQGWSIQFAQDH